MLKEVAISSLKPNPFRRLDEYPIIREKVDALAESFEATGYWGNIIARPVGKEYEIAFGHHRLIALNEKFGGSKRVEVIVRDLSNEQMLKMMARENMEEWGTSAWVELETIRSVIEAYGKGEIELPAVADRTPEKHVRHVAMGELQHPYTKATVAEFLGWTNSRSNSDTLQPNHACETAFRAIDMIDAGFIRESDLRGLQREHMSQLVTSQWSIYQANIRAAEQALKDAAAAEKAADKTDDARERRRLEKKAEILKEQAESARERAKVDAKQFGKEAATMLRSGASTRDVRREAEQRKPSVQKERVIDLDTLAGKVEDALARVANGDDSISANMPLIRKNIDQVSGDALASLDKAFSALIERLQTMRKSLKKVRV